MSESTRRSYADDATGSSGARPASGETRSASSYARRARGGAAAVRARWVRGGVVAALALAAAIGAFAIGTPARPAVADECFERYVPPPVDERGIQCPGNPAVWKSFTFASNGFGYYTETEDLGDGASVVTLGYRHQDGRVAISILACDDIGGCEEIEWNGVLFPFGH